MPPAEIASAVGTVAEPLESLEGVRAVAETFGTSTRATIDHLANLGWISEYDRESLKDLYLDPA